MAGDHRIAPGTRVCPQRAVLDHPALNPSNIMPGAPLGGTLPSRGTLRKTHLHRTERDAQRTEANGVDKPARESHTTLATRTKPPKMPRELPRPLPGMDDRQGLLATRQANGVMTGKVPRTAWMREETNSIGRKLRGEMR